MFLYVFVNIFSLRKKSLLFIIDRVRGVKGLRVIDASIMPELVNANTQAATYMIGEKGADLIKEDWGYSTDPLPVPIINWRNSRLVHIMMIMCNENLHKLIRLNGKSTNLQGDCRERYWLGSVSVHLQRAFGDCTTPEDLLTEIRNIKPILTNNAFPSLIAAITRTRKSKITKYFMNIKFRIRTKYMKELKAVILEIVS